MKVGIILIFKFFKLIGTDFIFHTKKRRGKTFIIKFSQYRSKISGVEVCIYKNNVIFKLTSEANILPPNQAA